MEEKTSWKSTHRLPGDFEHTPGKKERLDSVTSGDFQERGISDSILYHHPQAAQKWVSDK